MICIDQASIKVIEDHRFFNSLCELQFNYDCQKFPLDRNMLCQEMDGKTNLFHIKQNYSKKEQIMLD